MSTPVTPDDAGRRALLTRVAEAHNAWERAHLDGAPFKPETRPDSDDYNLWHLDMDADPATLDEFVQAVGDVRTDVPAEE